ncbi:MAG: FadR family transcriptional regulator, partial [Oscillospiraceae bacterium]|nr:FadR family transcriptional regulator [Oscillospiraceae bacterium]
MHKRVSKENLDQQILTSIKDAILAGEWPVGSKIPSETQLAQMYDASRPTVRVAIQKLNTMGFLETKVGVGTFVKNFDFTERLDTISNLIATPDMLDDVVEFRQVVETTCIRLAVEKASDEELLELKAMCDEYGSVLASSKDLDKATLSRLAMLDYNIHYRICELSGNALFAMAYAVAQGALKNYFFTNLSIRMARYKEQN